MRFVSLIVSLVLLLLAVGGGCGPSMETRSYRVTVENISDQPVTIWLTKSGPPFEDLWASPEDLAHPAMGFAEREGAVLEPGDAGTIPADGTMFEGTFAPGVDAVLRVYTGRRTFSEMLAASSGAGTLGVFVLPPGSSTVTVTKPFPVEARVTIGAE